MLSSPYFSTRFQSTPPARGATEHRRQITNGIGISIHAPREGGDDSSADSAAKAFLFQSTPPARGATGTKNRCRQDAKNFNPRPPRGGRLLSKFTVNQNYNFNPRPPRGGRHVCGPYFFGGMVISIHAPREGGDISSWKSDIDKQRFQSTPPARGATSSTGNPSNNSPISIHAPREGGDFLGKFTVNQNYNFNPRPPRGGRR